MELTEIAERVFGKIILEDEANKIISKTSKKMFLLEIRDWTDEFLKDLRNIESEDSDEETDQRPGRIGCVSVYFTLDRSFGIVAINQEGLNVVAACRFATVTACCAVFSGKWMYELHLGTKGIMQIGWCSNVCRFSIDRGCGDTLHSYAFDGSRLRSWNMLSYQYGELWKSGDVIGICIDLDDKTIEFHRNGKSMGIAFRNVMTGLGMAYLPCISLVEGESIYANFGARPFKYPVHGFEPLQKRPDTKIRQTEYVLMWLEKLTNLVVPDEPNVLKCDSNDIDDQRFWNRFYSIICYHMNTVLCSKYCVFSNFLPFVCDIVGIENDKFHLENFDRIMDELWVFVKERHLDKSLYLIFNYLLNCFKEVSQTLYCPSKIMVLKLLRVFLMHEKTRKYIIKTFLFERLELFAFLHHKPLDDNSLNDLVGEVWWDTKDIISNIEKHKLTFKEAFEKIGKSYDELEKNQCKFLEVFLINTDGNEFEPSSRMLFLKKLRKFFWHEMETSRNDIHSKLPTSLAYAAFLRTVKLLKELWAKEVGQDEMEFQSRYFYDHTFRYTSCDRIGGLEHFLVHLLRDDLIAELGEDHRIFKGESSERQFPFIPVAEIRTTGLTEIINILDGNEENAMENLLVPTTSNGPLLQAIFAPFFKDALPDLSTGNMDNKLSLLELYEDMVMFFMSSVAKHCRKIAKAYANFYQCASNFNSTYNKIENESQPIDELLLACLKSTYELQKSDLEKRSKKNGWIKYVILTEDRFNLFLYIFNILLSTVEETETREELFAFLPDFYLEACDLFSEVLIKNFSFIEFESTNESLQTLLMRTAELMIILLGDNRIKHIDCKKIPSNILATFAANSYSMQILEAIDKERSVELLQKLMTSYSDRHWKATNWILVRFWHGDGFGFRYTSLPHHSITDENLKNPSNFVLYNIACCPSHYYQKLIREQLLDTNASIPILLDSMITELHWIFGEFLTPMQEMQRAIERNEQLLMMSRLYKLCSAYFDKTVGLLRVFDMYISVAPEVFLESYYPESMSLTKRIIQVVLLIIHRISSKQGCFRTVLNSRITMLENVEYFPIESACIAILLDILKPELENFDDDNLVVPLLSRMILHDPSFDFDNLNHLIGSPETRHSTVVSLHDYDNEMLDCELAEARKMLKMLHTYISMMSLLKVIPEEELCTICYSAPFDVKFAPCGHNSCLSCISYYITKNRLCFFCKREIVKVIKIKDDEVIEELSN